MLIIEVITVGSVSTAKRIINKISLIIIGNIICVFNILYINYCNFSKNTNVCFVCLKFVKKCSILLNIGNEVKADVSVAFDSSTYVERLEVVFIC